MFAGHKVFTFRNDFKLGNHDDYPVWFSLGLITCAGSRFQQV